MTLIFTSGPTPNTVRSADGKVLTVPEDWVLVLPGDAALTRRVKAAGDHWVVAEKRGRKDFSRGIWAVAATVEQIRGDLEAERSTESFAKTKKPRPDAVTRPAMSLPCLGPCWPEIAWTSRCLSRRCL